VRLGREMLLVGNIVGDDRPNVTAMNWFSSSPDLEKTMLPFGFDVAWAMRR
ncbi:hypothetical protein ACLOJK_034332, partial [Asimina triloba]